MLKKVDCNCSKKGGGQPTQISSFLSLLFLCTRWSCHEETRTAGQSRKTLSNWSQILEKKTLEFISLCLQHRLFQQSQQKTTGFFDRHPPPQRERERERARKVCIQQQQPKPVQSPSFLPSSVARAWPKPRAKNFSKQNTMPDSWFEAIEHAIKTTKKHAQSLLFFLTC